MQTYLRPEFALAVRLNRVKGWRWVRINGHNNDVDAGTEDLWTAGGVMTHPTAAAAVAIVSTSANDAVAGTGAQEVFISGLDAAYNPISERVALNGVGAVNTAQSFMRVTHIECTRVGSVGANDGDISGTIGGNTQFLITASLGRSLKSHFTIPRGHTGIVQQITCVAGRTGAADIEVNAQFRLRDEESTNDYASWQTYFTGDIYELALREPDIGLWVPEYSDFRVQAVSTGTNVAVSAIVSGYLVDNNYLDGRIA